MIVPLNAEMALFVVTNADEMGQKEMTAAWGPKYVPKALEAVGIQDHRWAYIRNGEPQAMFLGRFYADGDVYVPWIVKTPRFPRISPSLTHFLKETIMPAIADTPASRAESFSLAEDVKSHRWLRRIGAKPADYHAGFGRQGEDVIRWRWTR